MTRSQQTPRRWWAECKTTEFETAEMANVIAIVPLAAVEQHGPHLPLGTDMMINEGLLAMLAERAPASLDIRILPVQSVGKSDEHVRQAGTLTLPARLLIEAWTELGLSVARAGVRRIVFINSHGGNEEVMGIVARELRVRASMLAVKSAWSRFGLPDGLVCETEQRLGIHGGEVETSLMLHFRPDLVAMDEAENFGSAFTRDEQRFTLLRPTGPYGYSWLAGDLNPQGVVGNARQATAGKGRTIAVHQVEGLITLLADMSAAPLPD